MNHVSVWRLAGPMILSNISFALLGMVDTAVIGHLDSHYYLGGIALGAVIFNFIYWGLGFLRMSTTGLTAKCHGRQDHRASYTILYQSLLTAGIISLLILILQYPLIELSLWFLQGSNNVEQHARIYLSWSIWGVPAGLFLLVIMGWLLGIQNARAVLYLNIATNLLNIILDVVFVLIFNLDVRGVALASVISLYSGLLLAFFWVYNEPQIKHCRCRIVDILNIRQLKKILSVNQNIFIRTLCLLFVFAFFTQQGAQQSDVILAANAVLLSLQSLLALALDGFANAVEALTGKACGAHDKTAFNDAVKTCSFWSLAIATGFTCFYGFSGQWIINLLTDIADIRTSAYSYLPWMVLSPLISVWCFLLDGLFVGTIRSREMRDSMLCATGLIFLPAWWLLKDYGNHGLWLAFMLFFAARGIILTYIAFAIQRKNGFMTKTAF